LQISPNASSELVPLSKHGAETNSTKQNMVFAANHDYLLSLHSFIYMENRSKMGVNGIVRISKSEN
jgi:hypothetical protein